MSDFNCTGWCGPLGNVKHAVRTVGGDRNEDGEVLYSGVCTFLGLQDDRADAVVGADAMYYVDGEPVPLAPLMNSTSYGIRNVAVF